MPSRRHKAAMLSSPRRPDTTIRIFSSAVYCLRVLRRISRTVLSAASFLLIDFCLIFVPFGHDDEPEILRYAITSICPKGADVRHTPSTEQNSASEIITWFPFLVAPAVYRSRSSAPPVLIQEWPVSDHSGDTIC